MRLTAHHKRMKMASISCHSERAKSPEVARGDSVDRLAMASDRRTYALPSHQIIVIPTLMSGGRNGGGPRR